jgi:hypothetical protein
MITQDQLDALKARIDRTLRDVDHTNKHSAETLLLRDVRAILELLPPFPPPPVLRAWWMNDNHTFAKIDLTASDWREQVMAHFDRDPWGAFFIRVMPKDRTVFDLSAHGPSKRDEFMAKVFQVNPDVILRDVTNK